MTEAEQLAAEQLMADLEDAVRLGEDELREGDVVVPGEQHN